jgi:hypothetical protein
MNTEDRAQFDLFLRRLNRLEASFAELRSEFQGFTARLDAPVQDVTPPPVPPPAMPPIPEYDFPPTPVAPAPEPAPVPPVPVAPAPEGPGFEIQFGRWLARIGVVFAVLTLIFFSLLAYDRLHQYIGPWTKLGVLALASSALIGSGLRLERSLLVYGRTLAGGGLACLYYTIYGATYVEPLRVITSPLLGGVLLLAWSAAVLVLAERRKSELLSLFAISLAYFSSAITPVGEFTMAANLLLAVTAIVFLVRNAWTGLSFLCLIGTYLGFVRQLFGADFDVVRDLAFWPAASYLTGAWVIFTAGIFLANTPAFVSGKRMAFLWLNNGAWAGLLLIAVQMTRAFPESDILLAEGGALLAASLLAQIWRGDGRELAGAYLSQGTALATAGICLGYGGETRSLVLLMESVFLVAAGAWSRNWVLRIGGAAVALLGIWCTAFEIDWDRQASWVLPFGGAAALLANAWFARFDFWREPREVARARFLFLPAWHILLALGLLAVGIGCRAPDAWIAPDLALAALVLCAAIYAVPLFELPALSQLLLVLAQIIAFLPPLGGPPASQGMSLGSYAQPQWSMSVVALITFVLSAWWPRQKQVRTGWWLGPLLGLYALAMVAFVYDSVALRVDAQNWMMSAAAISLVFVAFGAWTRLWTFMAAGQLLLGLAVVEFVNPENLDVFPWTWWAAAVPIAVVSFTAWVGRSLLPRYLGDDEVARGNLAAVAAVYQSIAIAMLVRWIFGIVPAPEITLAVLGVATALLVGGVLGRSAYLARAGFVLDLVGAVYYLNATHGFDSRPFTWLDAVAVALFLAQPVLLRQLGRGLVTGLESWGVVLSSSLLGWIYISDAIEAAGSQNLTPGWALFALALTLLGFVGAERRQRWCGLGILAAAFARVAFHDFWTFSDGGKVLTFLVLTVACLGLSFVYYKFSDRLKRWL